MAVAAEAELSSLALYMSLIGGSSYLDNQANCIAALNEVYKVFILSSYVHD